MGTKLALQDIWFHYNSQIEDQENWAVKGITLTIDQGEYISIIGSNGSGKSTLACLLNGLFIPTQGTFLVNDQRVTDDHARWELKRRVGMVFQNPDNQIVAPSVLDDIAFGLENLGISREEMRKRIPTVFQLVGLAGMEKREPHHLSGGQKQRLAIAGILAMQPDIIIFDESTSMLDPEGRSQVLDLMDQLHQQGISIIHITHQSMEAFRAERMIVMHEGKVILAHRREELYAMSNQLVNWGLDIPFAIQLHQDLLKSGWPLSEEIASEEQLVSEIWTLI
jgi:energy-coupling factor transport system ATP-binding protein